MDVYLRPGGDWSQIAWVPSGSATHPDCGQVNQTLFLSLPISSMELKLTRVTQVLGEDSMN